MIQFLKYRFATGVCTFLFFSAFIGRAFLCYQSRGSVFSYSIDFTGGTQILFKFANPISPEFVREILTQSGFENADTRSFANDEVMVRVKEYASGSNGIAEKMSQALESHIGSSVTILQNDAVGPGIGEEMRTNSAKAVLLALLIMLLYIGIRFWSYAFAIGAFVALAHDVFAMLAMILFFNIEISVNVISAILLILGYSINDTIVIFSQIRDNLAKNIGESLEKIVDASLNHTLRRTILTSLSTALPVLVMLLMGGEALFSLAFTLFVGVIFGTYSSVYIASPIMMLLYK